MQCVTGTTRHTRTQDFNPRVCSAGHICLLALLLTSGIVKASQEAAENKLIPENEKDDDGRFFFSTGTSTGSNSDSTITLTLGVGDILLAVLALALSVAAGVVIAGLLLGNPLDGSSGYSGTS